MIHFENINKTYPGAQPLHVLKGLNLHIKPYIRIRFGQINHAQHSGHPRRL